MRRESSSTDLNRALHALQSATVAFADAEADSTQTLQLALDHLIEVTGADAGAVAVPGEGEAPPRLLAERSLQAAGPVSRTVLAMTLADGSGPASITDPPASASVYASSITSILCTPVRRRGKTLAAVYLDRRDKPPFDDLALRLAVSFASILALAFDLTSQKERAEETAEEARGVAGHAQDYWRFGAVVTRNRPFAACLQLAERAAQSDATVLLLGDTGAGKEHLARCIHAESSRRKGPFIALNCAAIPETLLESELFGHERGAFTGAAQSRRGKFELAHGGTLFFDEIGELPLHLQPKLLRVLDDKRVTRLGGADEKQADVRIVVATNRDLAAEVRQGRFREDLYYRLNVISMTLPPLRERLEDIPRMAQSFLQLESERSRRELRFTDEALRALSRHSWPGNVRELRNAVEKLCVLTAGPDIGLEDVQLHLTGWQSQPGPLPQSDFRPLPQSAGSRELHARIAAVEQAMVDLKRTLEDLHPASVVPPAHAGQAEPLAAGSPAPADQEHRSDGKAKSAPEIASLPEPPPDQTFRQQIDEAARQILSRTIRREGSISAAARVLAMSRQHLYLKCKTLGLGNH